MELSEVRLIMKNEFYANRIRRTQALMQEKDISCFLVSPSTDLKYLCDYHGMEGDERLLVLAIPREGEPFMLANAMYRAETGACAAEDIVFWPDGADPYQKLAEELWQRGYAAELVAVDQYMPARFVIGIQDALKQVRFYNGSGFTSQLRVYKDRHEMDLMAEASRIADLSLAQTVENGRRWIGKSENDFWAELEQHFLANGMSGGGGIVAVGEHAAVPHHNNSDTLIRDNDCLLVDYDARYQGYLSDMTRTFFLGTPSQKFRDVYAIVLEANLAGEAAAKAGNCMQDVDRAARSVIAKYGYGEYFIHRTGHGIGMDVHEGPSAQEGELAEIRPGMIFSCEPGIYLPGEFGVRIEDLVMIEEDGSTRILNRMSKELTILE